MSRGVARARAGRDGEADGTQDEALDFYVNTAGFYVNTLGLEVADDQDLGFMRWLTVRVPGRLQAGGVDGTDEPTERP
jgi:hypothetical protein